MNKLFYNECRMGGVPEYSVTLVAGEPDPERHNDLFIRAVTKTRYFVSAEDAQDFFQQKKHITEHRPYVAVELFQS